MLPSVPEEDTPLLPQPQHHGKSSRGGSRRRAQTKRTLALLSVAVLAVASLMGAWLAAGQLLVWGEAHSSSWQQQQAGEDGEQEVEQQQQAPSGVTAADILGWRAQAKQARGAPNIIFILADDLGYNDVGWAGDDFAGLTPTLDALRETGVELTSYYTQQLCTPARAALLTGRYPFKMGMQGDAIPSDGTWGLPSEFNILPQYLAEAAGYRSHLVGKWHLGHAYSEQLPTSRGFTSSYGLLTALVDYVAHNMYDENPEYVDFINGWAHEAPAQAEAASQRGVAALASDGGEGQGYACVGNHNGTHSTTLFTDRAFTIADEWIVNGRDTPLFLYMAYQNPHYPRIPDPNADYSAVQGVLDAIEDDKRRSIAELVYNLDTEVSRLLVGLQERGALDNSIVVFASDNGPCHIDGMSVYPLRGSKNYTYEGGSKVRAFATSSLFPESVVNTTYDGLFHVTDWVPTLLEMAAPGWSQTETAQELDGVNQLPVFMGDLGSRARDEVVYNIQETTDGSGNRLSVYGGLRQGDWKYLQNEDCVSWYDFKRRYDPDFVLNTCVSNSTGCVAAPEPQTLLFNLRTDPLETTDLAAAYPPLVSSFASRMEELAQLMVPALGWYGLTTEPLGQGAAVVWDEMGCVAPWLSADVEGTEGEVEVA